jgi:hypothetical protein
MAMACFRLLALGWRPFPAFNVPRFARETALPTVRLAAAPYRRFVPAFLVPARLVEGLFLGMEGSPRAIVYWLSSS